MNNLKMEQSLLNMQEAICHNKKQTNTLSSNEFYSSLNKHWNALENGKDEVAKDVLNTLEILRYKALVHIDLAEIIYKAYFRDITLNTITLNNSSFVNVFNSALLEIPYLESDNYSWNVGQDNWNNENRATILDSQRKLNYETTNPVKILSISFPQDVAKVKESELNELADKLEYIFMAQKQIQPNSYIKIKQNSIGIIHAYEVNLDFSQETGKFFLRRGCYPIVDMELPDGDSLHEMLKFVLYNFTNVSNL